MPVAWRMSSPSIARHCLIPSESTPVTDQAMYVVETNSAAATHAWGQMLGKLLPMPMVVALQGELGAGKTLLTQGLAAGLGITRSVTSPTFVFVNEYELPNGNVLIHIDSYRLGESVDVAVSEAFTFGLEEILARPDAIIVIEWAELVAPLLPADHLHIALHHQADDPTRRRLVCTAHGPYSDRLLQEIRLADPLHEVVN